ncbi:hypothetical protein D9M69_439800 [compost metagenome]
MVHQAEGNFVRDRQRSYRHAGLARFSLDHRRAHALTQHGNAFIGEGAEHPRREETAAVIDHNRGFLDLQDVIEAAGQGFIAGVGALDVFHQRHFFHGAEKMQADELALIGHGTRQAADRQGRGVGGDHRVRADDLLRRQRDFGLQIPILEHRLDDQVATGQVGIAFAGLNA